MACPRPPSIEHLRDGYFPGLSRIAFGLVRWRSSSFRLGPLELLAFGPGEARAGGWAWPIRGGLLAARPGGWTGVSARPGELVAYVDGYRPRLPGWLYRLTQLPVHRLMTRVLLLRERGRRPPPGVPAAPSARIAAELIDIGMCAALAMAAGRSGRLRKFVIIGGAYHVGFWSVLGGRTTGARLLRLRVMSLDGSPLSPGQAFLRLLATARAVREFRAAHDELAGTEVITTRT